MRILFICMSCCYLSYYVVCVSRGRLSSGPGLSSLLLHMTLYILFFIYLYFAVLFFMEIKLKIEKKNVIWDIAGFQFLDLYLRNQILSGSIMTSSFVWSQILLLCPFHKVLENWENRSFSFGSNISPAFSFHRVFMVYCCFYRQLTN